MEKHFRIVPRGIGLVIGCCTFPTWNGFPGFFADLATGNAVVVKPHPAAILPLALTVRIAREVLAEAGFDPNVVTLVAHDAGDDVAQKLALRPEVRLDRFHRQRGERRAGSRRTRGRRRSTRRSRASTRSSSTPPTTSRASRATSRSRSRSTPGRCARRRRTSTCRKDGIETGRRPPHVRPGRLRHRRRRAEAPRRSGTRRRDPRRGRQRRRDAAAGEGAQARQRSCSTPRRSRIRSIRRRGSARRSSSSSAPPTSTNTWPSGSDRSRSSSRRNRPRRASRSRGTR